MKISLSQRIYFFTISCCILFIGLVSSILLSSQTVELAFTREYYAQKVENHATILKQLIISSNLYNDNYNADEWLISQRKLANQLKLAPVLTPQQQTLQNSINSQNSSIKLLFDKISENQLTNASETIKKHLKARLIMQLEMIRSDSVQLSNLVQKDIHNIIKREVFFIICVVFASVLILLYGSFRLNKVFKSSLNEVKKAFENNHSGNFQKIELSTPSEEFESIVNAFNEMNGKLNDTTVSLEVMKKVVDERTQVLQQLSNTDPLTKVANRRALFERGNMEFSREHRTHNHLTLMLLDCDYFKNVNDLYGHQVGDGLLQHVCKICQQEIREIDFLARYGGEEFIIILPNCDLTGGIEIANRIQSALANCNYISKGKEISMTLSIGVCTLTDKHTRFEQLVNDADNAMYLAKKNGRNRIEVTGKHCLH